MVDNNRKLTRNKMWPDTEAVITYRDTTGLKSSCMNTIKGHVDNLGSDGCFVVTDDIIPTGTDVEITIDFQPENVQNNAIKASGKVVRIDKNGIAFRFKNLDATRLGECIISKLNSLK